MLRLWSAAKKEHVRSRSRLLRFVAIGFGILASVRPGLAEDSAPLDLMGTWYVLVHYRDSAAEDPKALQWKDRIWIFEKRGSRMQWTDYPTVLFSKEGRRFEELPSGRRVRTAGAWEPDETDMREIREGLEVNSLGMRAKSLRGNPQRGFRSLGEMNIDSASTIGYSETWEIQDLGSLPQFLRRDVLGGARAESLEGTTAYRSEKILEGGERVEGRFERDSQLHGTFRMIRAGEVERARPRKSEGDPE